MITDPIPFLANIIAIAHSDGKLSPAELAQVEAMRTELNLKKADLTKATKLVEEGGYRLTPVGSFADQIKNLECILRVAYADDDLDAAESDLVGRFCQQIGLYQDQLDKIAAEVLTSLTQKGRICPSCGAEAGGDAQFCPKCGSGLTAQQEAVRLDFEIPQSGIAIEFADSTAGNFHKALESAKAADSYQTCQRMKKLWHLAVYNSGSVLDALPLAQALSGIRNRKAYLNGAEVSWDELFGFSWCASQRSTAYRPIEYCFGKDENRINPWGCKLARFDWADWSPWFSYGRWEKGGLLGPKYVWRFDKQRIQHELATHLFRVRYCPHLDTRLSETVLRLLPETVAPERDKNWKYNRCYEELPGSIKMTVREGSGEYAFDSQFWADGVRPHGHQVLVEILAQAFKELGVTHISPKALLE